MLLALAQFLALCRFSANLHPNPYNRVSPIKEVHVSFAIFRREERSSNQRQADCDTKPDGGKPGFGRSFQIASLGSQPDES
jgi:hypothetical protein